MAASKQLSAVITFGGRVASSFKRETTRLSSSISRIGTTISKVKKRQAGLRREIHRARKAGQDVSALKRRYDQLGGTVTRLEAKQRRLARTQAFLRGVWQGLKGAATRLATVGITAITVAATAASAALVGLMSHSVQWSVEIDRNARRLGTTTDALQELRLAAAGFGLEADKVDDGLADLGERIAEAISEPDGSIADTFRRIGIDAQRLRGLDIADQLGVVGDALRGLSDDEQRLFAARELAGDEGADAILVLTRDGADGLNRLRRAARTSIVSPESQRRLRDLGSAFASLRARGENAFRTIAASLAPVVTEWLQRLSTALDRIDFKVLAEQVTDIATTIKSVGNSIESALGPSVGTIGQLVEGMGGWVTVSKAAVFLVAAPIVGVAVAARAGLAILQFGVDMLTGTILLTSNVVRSLGAYFTDTWRRASRAVGSAMSSTTSFVDAARARIGGAAANIRVAFENAWTRIKAVAFSTLGEMVGRAASVGSAMRQILTFGGDGEVSPGGRGASRVENPRVAAVSEANRAAEARGGNTTHQAVNVTVNGANMPDVRQLAQEVTRQVQRGLTQQTAGALSNG